MAARARVFVFDGPRRSLAPLAEWLLGRGFAVRRGEEADAALATLGGGVFELVVADALVQGGVEFARMVRADAATKHLPVAIVAGDDPAGAAAQALAVGADEILTADQDEAELLARLDALSRLAVMEAEWLRREAVLRRFGVEEPRGGRGAAPAPERLRIVLVGEAGGEQVQVAAALGGGVTAIYADGPAAALEILDRQDLDAAVVTSFRDPAEPEGLCRALRRHPRLFDLPVLLVARPELVGERGLPFRWGMSDVLYQPLHPARFRLRMQSWVRQQRLRRRLRGEPPAAAAGGHGPTPPTRDALTGLYGHGFLHEYLELLLQGARPGDPSTTLLALGTAGMARLNAARGYVAGDRALAAAGATLARTVRAYDLVARLGGDEYAVVLRGCDAAGAVAVGERLTAAAAAATEGAVALRVGLAEATPRHTGAAALVKAARADAGRRAALRPAS